MFSIPTDNLTKSAETPVLFCSSWLSCECVVLDGWMINDLVSPILANNEKICVVSVTFLAASKPFFNPKVTMPLFPLPGTLLPILHIWKLLSRDSSPSSLRLWPLAIARAQVHFQNAFAFLPQGFPVLE